MNEVLVLSALRTEAKHGYGIARDVHRDSRGLFVLRYGTLYPTLRRLERQGMVLGEWVIEGRSKKVYALTPAGRGYLREQLDRLRDVLACVTECAGSP